MRIVSLDLETSGLDPARHRTLSIGAVDILTGADFYAELRWEELLVSAQAMRINRIDLSRPATPPDAPPHLRRLPASDAVLGFRGWLARLPNVPPKEEFRALGKNPASLDLPFLRSAWTTIGAGDFPFSHRCIDLNSVFAAIACAGYRDTQQVREEISGRAWRAFRSARPGLFAELEAAGGAEHHGLGDAWWNAHAWEECLRLVRSGASAEPGAPLEEELAFFDSKRADWLAHHQGKFALVRGKEVSGFYDTADSAYAEGVRLWGNVDLLIKPVLQEDPVELVPAIFELHDAGVCSRGGP